MMSLARIREGWVGGTLIAAYSLRGGERAFTAFGAIFASADCTGEAVASTAVTIDLTGSPADAAQVNAAGAAGAAAASAIAGSTWEAAGATQGGPAGDAGNYGLGESEPVGNVELVGSAGMTGGAT